ncbi:MAG TPA: EamA family transporter [Pseudonocardia sp.]|uniref:DMT family transporter n=1 Tax=Pseudonocardia sp. TaxID=60912 RepID=UPI002EDB63BE
MSSLSYSGAPARPSSRTDLFCVVAAGLLWGTGGLTGALLGQVAELHPLAIATYRLAGGGLSLLAVLACAGRLPRLPRRALPRVLTVGALTAMYQACYFAAVALTDLAVATLITLGAAPVLVIAAEVVMHRRRPSTASLIAIGLAVLGLGLLVGVPGVAGGGTLIAGALLAVASASGFAALTLLGRRPVAGLDASATIGYGFASGAVLLAAVTWPTVGLGFVPTAASVGLLLYLGWVPTALAYALFFTGLLRGVTASSAAVFAVLEPLTATVLGVLVLGARLGVPELAGGGLLCAAVLVAGVRR